MHISALAPFGFAFHSWGCLSPSFAYQNIFRETRVQMTLGGLHWGLLCETQHLCSAAQIAACQASSWWWPLKPTVLFAWWDPGTPARAIPWGMLKMLWEPLNWHYVCWNIHIYVNLSSYHHSPRVWNCAVQHLLFPIYQCIPNPLFDSLIISSYPMS